MKQTKPIDPCFPQLSTALNRTRMRKALQISLFDPLKGQRDNFLIYSCQIGERRYKPGKSCVVSYRIEIINTEAQSVQEQILYARLCKTDEGLSVFKRAREKALFKPKYLPPILYFPHLEMVIWAFPNDRKLIHLPKMHDLSFLREYLPRQLNRIDVQTPNRVREIQVQVIHYLPERSCMMRYTLDLENTETGAVRPWVLFGKIYPDDSGQMGYNIMRQLYRPSENPRLAQPLAYDADLKILWQSELPGSPFRAEEIDTPHCKEIMREIAVTVAALHRRSLEGASLFKLSDINKLFIETCDIVDKTPWARRVRSLVKTLLTQAENLGLETAPMTPIHGDLKIGNMLIDGGKIGLIDLDCVRMGDPLCDLGSFIANFYYNGIRIGSDASRMQSLVNTFCLAYSEQVEWSVPQENLRWHIAAAFIYEIVRRSLRQSNEKRMKHINQYLDLCEKYCIQA